MSKNKHFINDGFRGKGYIFRREATVPKARRADIGKILRRKPKEAVEKRRRREGKGRGYHDLTLANQFRKTKVNEG